MLLTLDIETLPTGDSEVIAELAESIKPPGTIKKKESIDAWMAENFESALADAVAKTSFSGLYGSIACICYALDDGEVFSVDSRNGEKQMLESFYKHVTEITGIEHHTGIASANYTVVGHNVAGFDLPFLKHRSIILEITPPAQIIKAFDDKWGKEVKDTMLLWSGDPHKRSSMDRLCKAFGFPGKGDFDGSMVAETWPVDPEKVISYCKDDVIRTREMYKRITFDFSSPLRMVA
jgi:predicted PolB exonuclease-like 3'-5' exonuclease